MAKPARSESSGRLDNQKKVFYFLRDRYKSKRTFDREELREVTSWSRSTFATYLNKHLKQFLARAHDDLYRVSESFRPFNTWDKFQREVVSQVRKVSSDYRHYEYDYLQIYEFFMPLTNEGHLRTTLDSLFFKDTLEARLRSLDQADLEKNFARNNDEATDVYLARACDWISQRIAGYSVTHVSGRYLAAKLATMQDVAKLQADGGRYLIDETTAVVRFIFPCSNLEEATIVGWFFTVLFVECILQVVNGEDEIWMVENGRRNRLHIWRVED